MPVPERMQAFFEDMGETASVATGNGALKTGTVLLDSPDEDAFGSMSIGRACKVTFATTSFPSLGHGDVVTIAGNAYRVETVHTIDDGLLSQAMVTPLDDET